MINLIGITGRISSGKNTVADIIKEESGYAWELKAYAYKLKLICSIILNVPVEKFEDREFKQSRLGEEWGNITVREMLQKIGTDCMRDGLTENVWTNSLFTEYQKIPYKYINQMDSFRFPNWVVTDVRFPNEAEEIKARGGIIIKVVRPSELEENSESIKSHASETSMDDYECDFYLQNNGTLEQLRETIKVWLVQNKL